MKSVAGAALIACALGQPGPSCNHADGDYPGCGLSKLTHAATNPIEGKKFMSKYFKVQAPGDECDNDTCDCSSDGAPDITQGRVFTTRAINPLPGPMPGNGFGLHLVAVPGHKTTGGMTVDEVEAKFNEKFGDMSKFDSFMDYNAPLATKSLQALKSQFDKDGVKYLTATWSDTSGSQYSSILVQVSGSQLILQLCQKGSLTLAEGETAVQLEQQVPDDILQDQESNLLANDGDSETFSKDHIVSLGINRAASAKAMSALEDFYVTGMGAKKSLDSTSENGATRKCFLWKGATASVCFTNRDDSETSTSFKVGDFEDMLNGVHKTINGDYPWCPMNRWFDNHYAIDSQSVNNNKILNYINSNKILHRCASHGLLNRGVDAVFDPTGVGIQMDTGIGLSDDCKSSDDAASNYTGGTFNPACTTDTSKCGSLDLGSVLV